MWYARFQMYAILHSLSSHYQSLHNVGIYCSDTTLHQTLKIRSRELSCLEVVTFEVKYIYEFSRWVLENTEDNLSTTHIQTEAESRAQKGGHRSDTCT